MAGTSINGQKRLQLIATVILVAGLASAVMIYLAAMNAEERLLNDPYASKSYRHGLELYGGKMNLLASDLMRWFEGLWAGKQRAYTIAWATILIAGVIYYISRQIRPEEQKPGVHNPRE